MDPLAGFVPLVSRTPMGQAVTMRYLILICLMATPAMAQDAMNAAEFDAYTRGKTLTFRNAGAEAYGIEQYQDNCRVIWSFLDGDCSNGIWYESNVSICFRYNFDPGPKCWKFYDDPEGLRAVFTNRPDSCPLRGARQQGTPNLPRPELRGLGASDHQQTGSQAMRPFSQPARL